MNMSYDIETIRLDGFVPYGAMYDMQIERRDAVIRGDAPSTLFLLQHEPVYTMGRDSRAGHLLISREECQSRGIQLTHTSRGGDITWHGPGQMVAYPILDLKAWNFSIRAYLRALEESVIRLLADYDIKAGRIKGLTGVWVGEAKVAAIGVAVRRWVTWHGLSLNVEPDMQAYEWIIPCGLVGRPVTSMRELLGDAPSVEEVMDQFEDHFRRLVI